MPTACYEFSIFELWARRGKFNEFVDEEIENLTRDKILDRINNHNTRQATIAELQIFFDPVEIIP